MDNDIVLKDTCYFVNVFQTGAVKKVNLSLYRTHIKLENSKNNTVIVDIPLSKIKKVRNIKTAGEIVIIVSLFKRYKLSWKNIDMTAIAVGSGAAGSLVNAIRGHKQSSLWVDKINELKSKLI